MTELDDRELLADLQRLVQGSESVSTPIKQGKEAQLLAAAQIDIVCLAFERQKTELRKRRDEHVRGISKEFIPRLHTKEGWIEQKRVCERELNRIKTSGSDYQKRDLLPTYEKCVLQAQDILRVFEDIDSGLRTIEQRILRYRALADKILNGLDSAK